MSTIKISELSELSVDTDVTSNDLLQIINIEQTSSTYPTGTNRKIKASTLANGLSRLTSIIPAVVQTALDGKVSLENFNSAGLKIAIPVVAASPGINFTLSNIVPGSSMDDITLASGNRILLKNQTSPAQNGIYVVQTTGSPLRATDFNEAIEINDGYVLVDGGTTLKGSSWVVTSDVTVVGTDPINFTQFSSAISGLSKSAVGLGNVDNTSDANKPVSTATQTALNLKANIASPTFTGTVTSPAFSGPLTGNVSGNVTGNVTGNVSGSSGSCTGNSVTATNLSTNRTNWSTNGTINAVVGQLSWKHYGNNHTIFDASTGTSPNNTTINNTNSEVAWTATYPTLMGWNGSSTYGVRVDSARVADGAGLATKASTLSSGGGNGTAMTFNWNGQGGQPTWVWGGNDIGNMYVWNPANFNVNYATTAGTCATISNGIVTASKLNGGQTGSAPVYGCRAWVNFDADRDASGATNTLNTNRFIRSSGNVASVLKTAAGRFTVTFTTSMPSANYAAIVGDDANAEHKMGGVISQDATYVNIGYAQINTSTSRVNPTWCSVAIFG